MNDSDPFVTPVLFLIFNRPEPTRLAFENIKALRPKNLFIAADGPRKEFNNDVKDCHETRQVVLNNIDWDCKLQTLFRDENLGCGVAVSQAINWFFNQVPEGIILEDDILVDASFFIFCSQLLAKYRDEPRVMMISGLNINNEWKSNKSSYHFSNFGGVWGWATWRRAWKGYDLNIRSWDRKEAKQKILKHFRVEKTSRKKLYDQLRNGEIDTWDLQWGFHRLLNNGLSVIPAKNLIKNIGFSSIATHTQVKPDWHDQNMYKVEFPLRHPRLVEDSSYDELHLKKTRNFLSIKSRLYKAFQKIKYAI